jgi:hypothetical protein
MGAAATGAATTGAATTGAGCGVTTATGVLSVAGCWTVVPQGAPRLKNLLHELRQLTEDIVSTTSTSKLTLFFSMDLGDMLGICIFFIG